MVVSFNCSVLSDKFNILDTFSVNIVKENNENIAKIGNNNNYDLKRFKVDHLKDYICNRKNVADSDKHAVKLWKVNVVDENGIKEKLKDEMIPRQLFSYYFQDELNGKAEFTVTNIHVITIIPTSAVGVSREVTYDTEKILQEILKDIKTEVPKEIAKETTCLFMPLKERNTRKVLCTITDNALKGLYSLTPKADLNFLVCGGAPGIGKTRWGIELFESLKCEWDPPIQWKTTKPHFLYFLLDFINGVRLSEFDQNLSASIIIGLRIAYKHFAQDKMSFDSFKYAALTTEKSLSAFNITLVLDRIRKSLNLKSEQQLIILLHIDEYQEIINFDQNKHWKVKVNSEKGIFKEILNETGKLMLTGKRIDYFVQTFLSGTGLRDATKEFKPTSYSFDFVECPLLTTVAMLEIVDHYANKYGDEHQGWMISASFLQILYDTGGLPRALQYVLEKSLSTEDFFNKLKKGAFSFFDDIFNTVADTLNKKYSIRDFVQKNKKASRQLLYHCICDIPVELEQILDIDNPLLTVEQLERDGYLILKSIDSSYFIQMPFYFIYLYNLELNIAPGILHEKFQPDPNMYWQQWELFVAQFEVFYNNLLLDVGIEEISLRDYYRGAFGKQNTLDIQIRLKRLEGICELKNQFPKTSQLKRRSDNMTMSLESGYVFINGKSAPFADSFIVWSKDILGLQQKWHNAFDFISIQDIKKECKKNNDAINIAKQKNMKFLEDSRVITIMFTSQQFNEADIDNIPDQCLVITKNNFGQYFGNIFSSRLAFSMLNDFNINFATSDQISNMIKGIGSAVSSQICKKRPYYNADDLISKNQNYNYYVNEAKKDLEKCSYTPYSIFKKTLDINNFLKNKSQKI